MGVWRRKVQKSRCCGFPDTVACCGSPRSGAQRQCRAPSSGAICTLVVAPVRRRTFSSPPVDRFRGPCEWCCRALPTRVSPALPLRALGTCYMGTCLFASPTSAPSVHCCKKRPPGHSRRSLWTAPGFVLSVSLSSLVRAAVHVVLPWYSHALNRFPHRTLHSFASSQLSSATHVQCL